MNLELDKKSGSRAQGSRRRMKNLNRALFKAFKYRWSIIGSFVCSIMVAACWGANLGAVYPFMEVVLKNHTLSEWADEQIATSVASINKLEEKSRTLQLELEQEPKSNTRTLEKKIAACNAEIESHRRSIASTGKFLPWIKKYAPNDPYQTLMVIIGMLLGATFLRGVFLIGNMVLVARVGQRTNLDLQNDIFRNVLNMELSELDVKGTGDLISRIRGETGSIGTAITNLIGKTLREPMKMAVCLILAAMINWRLLLFSLLVCPVAIYLMLVLAKSTKRANRRAMEESAKLLNRLYQALTYSRVVKAFTMENHERSRFQLVAKDVYGRAMKISWYSALARVNNEMLGVSIIGLAVLAGGYLVINQEKYLFGIQLSAMPMSFGEIITFFAFLCGVADPLRKMSDVYGSLQTGMVAADRVFPLIDQVPAVANSSKPHPIPDGSLSVSFENVWFGYGEDRMVLKGVSFEVPAGTSLAIIGPNGCGKSTMINLLPRFFDPSSGCIKINGLDLRDVNYKHLRRRVGYVTQLTMLFSDTIENNIRYGAPNTALSDVIAAAMKAHADQFIRELDEGYAADIGEHGGKLSGGQRQRISLARAILKDPDILLLDEATSQIDPQSEVLIHDTLREFIKGRTTILITHRLSTLELVDKIMVMDEGKIVDLGTHAELMRRCPTYRLLRETELKEVA
ncbi:MAG: ABC transporter ATP-binding protein [Pirellulaceae bacterium]